MYAWLMPDIWDNIYTCTHPSFFTLTNRHAHDCARHDLGQNLHIYACMCMYVLCVCIMNACGMSHGQSYHCHTGSPIIVTRAVLSLSHGQSYHCHMGSPIIAQAMISDTIPVCVHLCVNMYVCMFVRIVRQANKNTPVHIGSGWCSRCMYAYISAENLPICLHSRITQGMCGHYM
jgi:hypothetical protein